MKDKENYNFPDDAGRYGEFGGKYVSETLMSALEELENTYERASVIVFNLYSSFSDDLHSVITDLF